jgi:sugar phosphate isomerase/epimerase
MRLRNAPHRRQFLLGGAAAAASGLICTGSGLATMNAASDEIPASESAWQIGCFTRPFSRFTLAETFDAIAEAGFRWVGLMAARLPSGTVTLANASDEQIDEIHQEARRRQLKIAVTYYAGPPVHESLDAGVRAMRQLVNNCRRCGCETILLGGTSKPELVNDYYQAVRLVCDPAAEAGVHVVLKPHGGTNTTGPQCRKIVEQVGHDNFRIWYDPGNIYYYTDGELDPVNDVASVAGLVTGMCVKDFLPPKQVDVNPGSGQVRFPALMQRLQQGGFRQGPLIVETLAPGDLATTSRHARTAHTFLTELVRGSNAANGSPY